METGWALRTGWAHMSMRAWAPRVRDDHCKTWKQSWILTAVALLKQKGLGPNEKHERKALEKHTGKYEKNALGLRKKGWARLKNAREMHWRNALENAGETHWDYKGGMRLKIGGDAIVRETN